MLLLIYIFSALSLLHADVLIQFEPAPAQALVGVRQKDVYARLKRTASDRQRAARALLDKRGAKYRSFFVANAIAVENPSKKLVRDLLRLPGVKSAREDKPFQISLPEVRRVPEFSATDIPAQISALGVDRVWQDLKVTGKGVVVASIDTGAQWTHPALQSRYRGNSARGVNHAYSWHDAIHKRSVSGNGQNCQLSSPAPCDDHGHGTHTIGTMVGEDKGHERFGVAPDAQWISCRAFERGSGTLANFLECMDYFIAPGGRPEFAPHVLNLSWVCGEDEGCAKGDELLQAVRALKAAGILVVVAAGNNGPDCASVSLPPTSYTHDAITVGSYDHRSGAISEFSSRGPSTWDDGLAPTITAPGDFIRSSVPNGYDFKSGTSMASPHVAGVVALILSAKPSLIGRVDETMQLIYKTATPRSARQSCGSFDGRLTPNAVFGYGIINAYNAITF